MTIQSEHDFDELLRGTKLLAIITTWNELGIWDELAARNRPTELEELPGDTRALRLTANVLAHAGLLEGDGRRWKMSATCRGLHERGEMPTRRNFEFFEDLTRMPDVIRHGGPVRDAQGESKVAQGGVRPEDLEASRRFLQMLHRRSGPSAEATAEWLTQWLPAGAHILDVGGGHGRYAEAFLDRGLQTTLFDLPVAVDLARERYGDRMTYRAGDFHEDTFEGPYDAAFLSNILHGESPQANADIIRRLHAALRPGGWLLFKDMFMDETGRNPRNAVFFATTMLYYTQNGQAYTLRDVESWARDAGCELVETIGFDTFTLVLARKPEDG